MKAAVLVATYKRPHMLSQLLESLHTIDSRDIYVVDNDPNLSAMNIAKSYGVTYLKEGKPGIAAARNCALKAVGNRYEVLAFVDDDEWVSDKWLTRLIETLKAPNAAAVFGPVVPHLHPGAPKWVHSSRFFERARQKTGSPAKWPATNNCLVKYAALAQMSNPRFSEDFSATGGSDTEFFFRLGREGGDLLWCNEAEVNEWVPSERTTIRWIWRRGIRLGNVSARMLRIKGASVLRIIAIAIARMLLSPALVLSALLTKKSWGAAAWNLPKGIGMIFAVSGSYIREYGR